MSCEECNAAGSAGSCSECGSLAFRKAGDATIALLGQPNSGKSTPRRPRKAAPAW